MTDFSGISLKVVFPLRDKSYRNHEKSHILFKFRRYPVFHGLPRRQFAIGTKPGGKFVPQRTGRYLYRRHQYHLYGLHGDTRRHHLPDRTLQGQHLGRSVCHLLRRVLHRQLHANRRPQLSTGLACAPTQTFRPFLGRYADSATHRHPPAEKPHRPKRRRRPVQPHLATAGRNAALYFQPESTPFRRRGSDVRLPDEWGEELLERLVAEDDVFDSQDDFKQEFPGLAFVPESSGQCITGFLVNDSTLAITLYYQDITTERTESELTFAVNTDNAYTGIRYDRSGTVLDSLDSGVENAIHSYDLNRRAYLQGLTGLYNQIEFPYLNNFQSEGEVISIESAMLYLYPEEGSYGQINQLPDELRLYITDENNVLEDYVYGDDGVTVQTGDLVVDELYGKDTYYSFDITTFARNNFGAMGMHRQRLLLNLTDDDAATTFNQALFTNDPEKERQCRLDVRFKVYNPE